MNSLSIEKIKNYLAKGKINLDYLVNFYKLLTSLGICLALIFLLINIPFLNKSFKFEENIVLVIARIYEKEAVEEIEKLYDFKEKINALVKNGNYELEIYGINNYKNRTNLNKRNKTYLSSTPNKNNNKIKKRQYYLSELIRKRTKSKIIPFFMTLLSIFLVIIFFSVIISSETSFTKNIESAFSINKEFSELSIAFSYCISIEPLLSFFTLGFTISANYYSGKEIYLKNYKKNFEILIKISNSILNSKRNIDSDLNNRINYILKENCCNLITDAKCKNLIIKESFSHGFYGYLNEQIKFMREILPLFESNQRNIVIYKSVQEFENEKMREYISLKTLQFININIQEINNEIIKRLIKQLNYLFYSGGVSCAIALLFILYIQFRYIKQNLKNSKRMLLFIPIKKHSENSTLILIKNLSKL